MKITVCSKRLIENMSMPNVPHLVVSIRTPGDELATIYTTPSTLKVLYLAFYDLIHEVDGTEEKDADMFQPAQARQILAMVKAHPEAEHLIVHCDAGLSRSQGVGAALSKILEGDDSHYFKRYHPNTRVYRMILEEHYAPSTGE
jgi:predicted protein tyrosine phosphatase